MTSALSRTPPSPTGTPSVATPRHPGGPVSTSPVSRSRVSSRVRRWRRSRASCSPPATTRSHRRPVVPPRCSMRWVRPSSVAPRCSVAGAGSSTPSSVAWWSASSPTACPDHPAVRNLVHRDRTGAAGRSQRRRAVATARHGHREGVASQVSVRVGIIGYGLAGRLFHAPFIACTPDFI